MDLNGGNHSTWRSDRMGIEIGIAIEVPISHSFLPATGYQDLPSEPTGLHCTICSPRHLESARVIRKRRFLTQYIRIRLKIFIIVQCVSRSVPLLGEIWKIYTYTCRAKLCVNFDVKKYNGIFRQVLYSGTLACASKLYTLLSGELLKSPIKISGMSFVVIKFVLYQYVSLPQFTSAYCGSQYI